MSFVLCVGALEADLGDVGAALANVAYWFILMNDAEGFLVWLFLETAWALAF